MSIDKLRKKWGTETSDSSDKTSSYSNAAANENKSSNKENKYYKLDLESSYIPSLKIIRRDGHLLYLPYSHQPLIEYIPSEGLFIKTMQKIVLIKGRNLIELVDALGMQKVKWIKESSSGKDDGSKGIHIANITIEDVE